jgi:hypothetical protein
MLFASPLCLCISTWQRKLKSDPIFASRIAQLFLEGGTSPLLARQVAAFYLDQLALPSDWPALIRDVTLVQNAVRRKLIDHLNA